MKSVNFVQFFDGPHQSTKKQPYARRQNDMVIQTTAETNVLRPHYQERKFKKHNQNNKI